MEEFQLRAALAAKALWQPDFFLRATRGPMRTVWAEKQPQEATRFARRLASSVDLIVEGTGDSNSMMSTEWNISLTFRCAPNLSVCALCVQDQATADWQPPARRGPPRPYLIYVYPTSANKNTLVRWLVADYLKSGGRQIDCIEAQGRYDLGGIVEDWEDS